MTLALSRIRAGSVPLRGPVQPGKTLRQRLAGPLKAEHLRLYLGAALAIGLVGIGVNALLFQHERRPAPLFGSLLAPFSSPSRPPAAPPVPKPASVERDASAAQSPAALPPARPADPADSSDPITDLLRGEARVDGAHLILAAQTALAKLGYPVKPDGNDGLATQQALRDFERVHSLPLSTEITPRLVKQLSVAARAGGR
ncbi:MAG: peptidoglycan-binding domain-containing protein [Roseiarcus sp.]